MNPAPHTHGTLLQVLLLDGKAQSAEADEHVYHELLVHPAMLLHANPKTVFVAGGVHPAAAHTVRLTFYPNSQWSSSTNTSPNSLIGMTQMPRCHTPCHAIALSHQDPW